MALPPPKDVLRALTRIAALGERFVVQFTSRRKDRVTGERMRWCWLVRAPSAKALRAYVVRFHGASAYVRVERVR